MQEKASEQDDSSKDEAAQQQDAQASSSSSTSQQPSAGILTDPTIVKLHHLAMLLSSSRYPTFWTTYRSEEFEDVRNQVLEEVVDFENGVRKVVLNGTAGAFKSISKKRLATYLGLDGELARVDERPVKDQTPTQWPFPHFPRPASDLDEFLASPHAEGWTVKGDLVEVPLNKDNVVKSAGVTREEVEIADLSRLIQQAAPSSAQGIRA